MGWKQNKTASLLNPNGGQIAGPGCSPKEETPGELKLSCWATLEDFGGFHSMGMCRQQSRKITRLIAQLIAVGGATFNLVDGDPFHQLMEAVAPRYKIPSRTIFSRTIVPSLYQSCVGLLKELLGKAGGQSVHFSTDLWSAPSGQHGFLSLTAHWWQPNVLQDTLIATSSSSAVAKQAGHRSFLLHAEVMDQQHTSDNIRKALQNMVAQWLGEQAGTQAQMGFVVTDGAANMIKALWDGRFVGVRCSAHVLHLVVKAALEDGSNTGRLSALLESCTNFWPHRSIKDSQLLREKQKKADLPEHRLKQDVGTRWNSTLDMLERILEQKKAIHAMSCHHFIGSNRTLGRADWALMDQVVTVLTPFRALTELLSKENASLAEVIPLFTHLSLKLDDFLSHREHLPGAEGNILPDVAALLTRLKKELTQRVEERMDNCPELMLATICDPRIKGKLTLHSNSLTAWREQLIARVRERQRKTRMQSQEVGGDSEDELEECGATMENDNQPPSDSEAPITETPVLPPRSPSLRGYPRRLIPCGLLQTKGDSKPSGYHSPEAPTTSVGLGPHLWEGLQVLKYGPQYSPQGASPIMPNIVYPLPAPD
ncbi:LOW QUALITY PROTEIN: zinc finger BED domain-containing protein 4-like [Rhinophrynus dorsalis]